jgi:hypothetical protein
LIHTLSADIPEIRHSMIAALGNLQPRHLLDRGPGMDRGGAIL